MVFTYMIIQKSSPQRGQSVTFNFTLWNSILDMLKHVRVLRIGLSFFFDRVYATDPLGSILRNIIRNIRIWSEYLKEVISLGAPFAKRLILQLCKFKAIPMFELFRDLISVLHLQQMQYNLADRTEAFGRMTTDTETYRKLKYWVI